MEWYPLAHASLSKVTRLLCLRLAPRHVFLYVAECSKFSNADFTLVVHGSAIVGEHIVHQ